MARKLLVLLALVGSTACGSDGPTRPRDDDPPVDATPRLRILVLEAPASTQAAVGSHVPVQVRGVDQYGDDIALPAETRLEVFSAEPYFQGSTVVQPLGSPGDFGFRVSWPGTVRLRARAGSVKSPPEQVTVEPLEPIVDRIETPGPAVPGAEVVLTGWRLDLLSPNSVRAHDVTLRVLGVEAGRMRLEVPALDVPADGCDPASVVSLSIEGARLFGAAPRLHYGEAEPFVLQPGDYRRLGTPTGEACLSFAPVPDALYTLFYIDTRPVVAAETTWEGAETDWRFSELTVTVQDRSVPGTPPASPSQRSSPPAPVPARDVVRPAPPAAGAPVPENYLPFIQRPLTLGERVWVDAEVAFEYEAARVLKIYGARNDVVLLGLESEGATAGLAGGSFRVDGALDAFADHGVPTLATALSPNFPGGYNIGQAAFLIRTHRGGFPAVAIGSGGGAPGGSPTGYVLIQSGATVQWGNGGPDTDPFLFAHEGAHLAQFSRDQDLCDQNPDEACQWGSGGTWAVEGNANFLAHQIIRASRGYSFDGNGEPAGWVQGSVGPLTSYGHSGAYSFGAGYGGSEWFMRHVLQRLVEAGWSYDDALGHVGRATYEPWYGWVRNRYWDPVDRKVKDGPPRHPLPGLVPRIREALGPGWDPVDALLVGGLTQAVDDLTSNPLLQNVTYRNAYELYNGPLARIELGTGQGTQVLTRGWTFGWTEIQDAGEGGFLTYGTSAEGVEWIVARTR